MKWSDQWVNEKYMNIDIYEFKNQAHTLLQTIIQMPLMMEWVNAEFSPRDIYVSWNVVSIIGGKYIWGEF